MTEQMSGPSVGAGDAEIEAFHYLNPEWQQNPYPLYDRIRRECPVAHSERYGGFWMLSKYEDVLRAYQEPEVFSSYPNPIPANSIGNQRAVIPVEIDPPDHTRYRHILSPLFTVHRLSALEAKIRAHMADIVDPLVSRGECEFASAVGKELPARVFLELMGFPVEHAPMFLDWCDTLMRGVAGDEEASNRIREATGLELYGYFAEELDRRDDEGGPRPGEEADFIDTLRGASFGGERPLTQFEILDCIFIVLLAGLDTTQGVLSNSMEFLATHEGHRKELLANPGLLDQAVEELLRWFAPVAPGRRLTRDTVVRGVPMREGDRVLLLTASACRDEEEFDWADTVDFHRTPNRHIAFGAGVHRCLGSVLARMELRIALQEWHLRIPEYHLKEATQPRHHLSAVAGVDELHLVFP
ncbi:MAG: cytochrome P450 [Acidimicrobiia bacterium]